MRNTQFTWLLFIVMLFSTSILLAQPPRQSLRISEVIDNGRYIMLNDNSLWEVQKEDQAVSGGWITPAIVKLGPSDSTEYPFKITNMLTQDSVLARKTTVQSEHSGAQSNTTH